MGDDQKSLNAWVHEAVDYVAYRLRKDPNHPLKAAVELVSPTMETLHGAGDRWDVSSWFEAVHPDDLPRVLAAHLRADETDEVFDERYRVVNADGSVRWVHTVSRPAVDEEGVATAYNGLILDITAQVEAERAAAEARAALEETHRVATAAWIAMGVTHDLNNVLQVVQMACSLALANATPANRELLQEVLGAVERGAGVGRRLTGHFRAGAHEVRPVDLAASVRETCRLFARTQPGLRLEVDTPDTCPIHTAVAVVEHALLNLLANAADALQGSGLVSVTLQREPEGARLRVADDGPGIPAAHRSRVFEPRFSTKGSTGLGLASSRQAIEALGGRLLLRDTPQTCFELSLPKAPPPRAEAPTPEPAPTPCAVAVRAAEPRLLERTVALLGHTVVDEAEADVVVVDDLPEATPAVPAILLDGRPTALSAPSTFVEVLHKPARIDELGRAIEAARRVGLHDPKRHRAGECP